MRAQNASVRVYPTSCTSAFCGFCSSDDACKRCPDRPALDAFKAWCESNHAAPADPIWSPNVYVAKVPA